MRCAPQANTIPDMNFLPTQIRQFAMVSYIWMYMLFELSQNDVNRLMKTL